jgi:hypothetical protein
MVGFAIALQQGLNGFVLHADLAAEKFVLAFQALDIGCRDWSGVRGGFCQACSSPSRALASLRSSVSKPSVNQP